MAVTAQLLPPVVVQSVSATAVNVVAVSGLQAPVAPGIVVYNCAVLPTNWSGTVSLAVSPQTQTLGGLSVGPVIMNTFTIVTTSSGLQAGTVDGKITVNP